MEYKKSNEALWWSLFSAGGVMSALFLPVLVIVTGLLLPWKWGRDHEASYEQILATVSWWPVRLALLGVIVLSFFHAAHRIRHVLIDLGWRHNTAPLSMICYGSAFLGTFATAWLLLTLQGPA